MSPPPNDREILAVHMSRRDLIELIDILKKAEELCEGMRTNAQEFRMHRVRLEVLKQSSVPPAIETAPERRESTRFFNSDVLAELRAKKGPVGDPSE